MHLSVCRITLHLRVWPGGTRMSAVTETTQTASPSFLTGRRTGERRMIVNLNQYRIWVFPLVSKLLLVRSLLWVLKSVCSSLDLDKYCFRDFSTQPVWKCIFVFQTHTGWSYLNPFFLLIEEKKDLHGIPRKDFLCLSPWFFYSFLSVYFPFSHQLIFHFCLCVCDSGWGFCFLSPPPLLRHDQHDWDGLCH